MQNKNIIIWIFWILVLALAVWYFGFYETKVASRNQETSQQTETKQQEEQKENPIIQEKQMTIVTMKTNLGDIKIELFDNDAPKTVANFVKLAKENFYDGTRFHRVIKNFMIQGGDPNSKDNDWSNDGMGGPGYKFEDEINANKLVRGVLAMANAGPNTNGSQFFIVTTQETPWLDGKHTAFGRVVGGMDVVDKIEALQTFANDNPQGQVTVEKIEVEEK